MALSAEVIDEYKTSLSDLIVNSKPLINMLTMLAEDHEQHAPEVVAVIEDHIHKCKPAKKLPVLYLIDSIMKNLGQTNYKSLFAKNIVQTFTSVFEQVDEKARVSMFKLRQTWSSCLPNQKMYMIDVRINSLMDPAWPITATPPEKTSIHVNPKFLSKSGSSGSGSERSSPEMIPEEVLEEETDEEEMVNEEALMRQQLIAKQQELLELQQARIKLELAEAKEKLKSHRKHTPKSHTTSSSMKASSLPLPPVSDDPIPDLELPQVRRDPRVRQVEAQPRDPRRKMVQPSVNIPDSSSVDENMPSSSIPFTTPMGGQFTGQVNPAFPGYPDSSFAGANQINGMPFQQGMAPVMHRGYGEFKGVVFPDDPKFSDSNDSDSSRSSAQDNRNTTMQPKVNVKDPRLRKQLQEKAKETQTVKNEPTKMKSVDVKRDPRRQSPSTTSPKNSSNNQQKDASITREGNRSSKDTQQSRSSKERESAQSSSRSPRKSFSDTHHSAKGQPTSKDRDSKSVSNLRDTFETEKRKNEEDRKKDIERDSKARKKESESRQSQRSSRNSDKSPEKSIKQSSSKTSHKGNGDSSVADKSARKNSEDNKNKGRLNDSSSRNTGEKQSSSRPLKTESHSKVNIKSEPVTVKSEPKEPVSESLGSRSIKREKRSEERDDDNERASKKAKLSKDNTSDDGGVDMEVDVKPKLEPQVSNDLSELFGSEDIDYRPVAVDQKGLPLQSPSSKGWDKFKASQPDQFAYDIELKKQRQDVDQRRTRQLSEASENQDTDFRVLRQNSFQGDEMLSPPMNQRDIPKELSLSQHSEIIIQAQKQLRDGRITAKQHQDLMHQVQMLMQVQQKLQEETTKTDETKELMNSEENAMISPNTSGHSVKAEALAPSITIPKSEIDAHHLPVEQDSHQNYPEGTMPNRDTRSPERPLERFKIPKKTQDMTSPIKQKRGLHELYPERIGQEAWESGPPVLSREFEELHQRPEDRRQEEPPNWVAPPTLEENRRPPHDRRRPDQFRERRGPNTSRDGIERPPENFRDSFHEENDRSYRGRRKAEDRELGVRQDWRRHGSDDAWNAGGERDGPPRFNRRDREGPSHKDMPAEGEGREPWNVSEGDGRDFRREERYPDSGRHPDERRHEDDLAWRQGQRNERQRGPRDERDPRPEERQENTRDRGRSQENDRYGPRDDREVQGPDKEWFPLDRGQRGGGHGKNEKYDLHMDRPGLEFERREMPRSDFDRPSHGPNQHGPHGPTINRHEDEPPEFDRPNRRSGPHGPEFDRTGLSGPEFDKHAHGRPEQDLPRGSDFEKRGPLPHDFNKHGPPRHEQDRPHGAEFDRPGPARPDFERQEFERPGQPFDRPGPPFDRGGPVIDRPGLPLDRPSPPFDRHGTEFDRPRSPVDRHGPAFDRSGPPMNMHGHPFERHGPVDRRGPPMDKPIPPFDRPMERPGPMMDRPGSPMERPAPFDMPGQPFDRPGPLFDKPRSPDRCGPIDRPGPPLDRPGPPFDRPGPPLDRPGPPFDRSGPPLDRPGPPFDRPGPLDRPGPPFDRPGPPFDRPGPPLDRPGPPFGRAEPPGPPMDRPGSSFDRPTGPDFNRPGSDFSRPGPPGSDFGRPDHHEERGPDFERPGHPFDRSSPPFDRKGKFGQDTDRKGPHEDKFDRPHRYEGERSGPHRMEFDQEYDKSGLLEEAFYRRNERGGPVNDQKGNEREPYNRDRPRRKQDDDRHSERGIDRRRRRSPPKENADSQDKQRGKSKRGKTSRDVDSQKDASGPSKSRSDPRIVSKKEETNEKDKKNNIEKDNKETAHGKENLDQDENKPEDKAKKAFDPNKGLPPWQLVKSDELSEKENARKRSKKSEEKTDDKKSEEKPNSDSNNKRRDEKPRPDTRNKRRDEKARSDSNNQRRNEKFERRKSPPLLPKQRFKTDMEDNQKHPENIPSLLDPNRHVLPEAPVDMRPIDRGPLAGPQFNPLPSQIVGPFPRGPQNVPKGDPLRGPGPPQQLVESYVDKYGDPRFRSSTDMGPAVSEEVVFGKRNYEIKLGAPPRKIQWGNGFIEVYADPSKRGIVIDNELMYRFGERVKEVNIRGKREKMFYHGKPLDIWIDGNNYEVRVDSPPKTLIINNQAHRIQVDGRDMMILIDKGEKGPFGGEPRFIFIDDNRMELRFDPPPRHILIDGEMCELKLNVRLPCINIKGVLHGIRFQGPPRDIFIDGKCYQIFTDHAVKLRVGNRYHYVALGGPCHELIIDGKWYEVKFDEPPKEINVGNKVMMVHIPGSPPEVKILGKIPLEHHNMPPMFNAGPMPGPQPPQFPGGPMMHPGMRPMMPGQPMPGPNPMGQPMPGPNPMGHPMPGPNPMGQPMPGPNPMGQPMPGPNPMGQPMPGPNQMGQPMPGPNQMGIPGFRPPNSVPTSVIPGLGNLLQGMPSSQPNRMPLPGMDQPQGFPNLLSSLFPTKPAVPASVAPTPAGGLDISSLLDKLVTSGIIKKEAEAKAAAAAAAAEGGSKSKAVSDKPPDVAPLSTLRKQIQTETFEDIPEKTSFNLSDLRILHNGSIQRLYAGVQCNSCGTRFKLDDDVKAEKYREHLDWHFRQNKLKKDDTKVTCCRRWYYGVNDWIQYVEVTDLEDQSKSNFFEQQQQGHDQPSTPTRAPEVSQITLPEGVSVIKCPAATGNDQDDLCDICHEPFEQYWDEELEEWHMRDAIRVNGKTYHPICYEDYTDVSEGTPSPSVLMTGKPEFVNRKTLTYEESSLDGLPHSSFVEERTVMNTTAPSCTADSASSNLQSSEQSDDSVIKTEHIDDLTQKVVKEEISGDAVDMETSSKNDTSALTDTPEVVAIKQEPISDSVSATGDGASLPQESNDGKGIGSEELFMKPYPKSAIPGLDVSFEAEEEQMDTSEKVVESIATSTPIKQEPMDTDSVVDSVASDKTVDVKMEQDADQGTSENEQSTTMKESQSIGESVKQEESDTSATETVNIHKPDSPHESHITEHESPHKTEYDIPSISHISPHITEHDQLPLSHPGESDPHTISHIQTVPVHTSSEIYTLTAPVLPVTLSPLNRVKVSKPPDVIEISQEVLEINSNASTPTYDELPSPPSPGS